MEELVPDSHFFRTKLGTNTHFTQAGNTSGPLVVLLHGLGGSTKTFETLLPHLPVEKYNIVSVDFEGFGKTELADRNSPLSIERHIANLDDLITFLQGPSTEEKRSVVIFGHSLGSVIALHLAARCPDSVAGLGLLGVGRSAAHIEAARQRMLDLANKVRTEGIDAAAELAMTTNFAPDEDLDLREEVRQAVAASDPEGYAQTCEMMVSREHVDPDYAKIVRPVVLVSGDQDVISPPDRARGLSKLLPGHTELVVVKGGHQPILSDFEDTKLAMDRLFQLVES